MPLVYSFLPDKTEDTYVTILQKIKSFERALSPITITTDYEGAMVNACRKEFPNAKVRGSFFHFAQSIFNVIQSEGLKQRYETDINFAVQMRILPAIAFVPSVKIVETFELLCSSDIFPSEAQSVVDSFEEIWIGKPDWLLCRRNPEFPFDMWNLHDIALRGTLKMDNAIDNWHRKFEVQIASHPFDIWKFINCIKKEQNSNETKIEQYISGVDVKKPKKQYQDFVNRIKSIVENYDTANILDYVRDIAHNLSY